MRPFVMHVAGTGAQQRIPLVLALRRRGFRVGVVGAGPANEFERLEIPFVPFRLQRRIGPLADLRSVAELEAIFTEHRPDVVHGFETKPAIFVPLAGERAGVRVRLRTVTGLGYVFSSGSWLARALRPVYRSLHRRAAQAASATVFQNEEDRREFLDSGMARPGREWVVPGSGVDVDILRAEAPDAAELAALREELGVSGCRVVTLVSRLLRLKGVPEFLEAAESVRERHPDVKFLLVGTPEGEGFQAVPQSLLDRHAASVLQLGQRDDVPALLALSDLFVLPTRYREGVPRALLEAGALGLPLVTTDVPGCRDVVKDGWNGRLVPPGDSAALAEAIVQLLGDAALRAEMGAHSYARVQERFTLDRVADEYARIYGQLLDEPGWI